MKAELPSTLSLGSVTFRVAYKGQIKRCYRCRETGNEAKNCDGVSKSQCFSCGTGDYLVSACKAPRKEIICTSSTLGHMQGRWQTSMKGSGPILTQSE